VTTKIEPEYRRLMGQIRSRIASGEYPVGQPIPSTQELHKKTRMSVPVVRRAVQELQKDGILVGHPGKGVFVQAMPEEADMERRDLKGLGEEVSGLRAVIMSLSESGMTAEDAAKIRADIARIEDNLIALYMKTGHDYPHAGTPHERQEAEPGRRRSRHGG
jgi:DNA-binding GntR family transcriptional regulator